ncbi:MAG: hypothetical protein CMF50_04320 [Legionellales bacterium]|nr:hypothetical protein [Legionellales bacterium]|tara:strand:+ start:20258 stop:20647 length:390 start_codon:yes stop_codon:yes gene_type:complete
MISLIKFLHMLCIFGIIGIVSGRLFLAQRRFAELDHIAGRLDWTLIALLVFGGITGSLMVLPKGYQFTTPWIMAAFIFVGLAIILAAFALKTNKKPSKWLSNIAYGMLLVIIVSIIHDAVTRQTFLPLH